MISATVHAPVVHSSLTSRISRADLRAKSKRVSNCSPSNVSVRCTLQEFSTIQSEESVASIITTASHHHSEQIMEVAGAPTPIMYVSFLALSLAFTVGTYITLNKIKLI